MTIEELKEEWKRLEENPYFLKDFKLPLNIENFKLIELHDYSKDNQLSANKFLDISYKYTYKNNYITIYFYNEDFKYITIYELENYFIKLLKELQNIKLQNRVIYPFKEMWKMLDIDGKLYAYIYNAKTISLTQDNVKSPFTKIKEENVYLWAYKNYFIKIRYSGEPIENNYEFNNFFTNISYLIENGYVLKKLVRNW